jgi:hypothetical protein
MAYDPFFGTDQVVAFTTINRIVAFAGHPLRLASPDPFDFYEKGK